MGFKLGTANEVTQGVDTLFERNLITGVSSAIVSHPQTLARAIDPEVGQLNNPETPQADQSEEVLGGTSDVIVASNRRVTSITFRAFTAPVTDPVLIIQRSSQESYKKPLPVTIVTGSDTVIDLLPTGLVFDLDAGITYTMTIVSASGATVSLAGDVSGDFFYAWDFRTLTNRPIVNDNTLAETVGANTTSDQMKVDFDGQILKAGVNGLELGNANSIQAGGGCLFLTDKSDDTARAIVAHNYNEERAFDRRIDTAGFSSDIAVFTIDANTLTNPSFLFTITGDSRLADIQVRSAGAQTDVKFSVIDNTSGLEVWQSMIASQPASGTFKIDFLDTSIGNVPNDLFSVKTYTFTFSSVNGDVLLLGETASDRPWLTSSFWSTSTEFLGYQSDYVRLRGVAAVDQDTTIAVANRTGADNRPFISIAEAEAALGAGAFNGQNVIKFVSDSYSGDFSASAYTNYIGPTLDAQGGTTIAGTITHDIAQPSNYANLFVTNFTFDVTLPVPQIGIIVGFFNGGISGTLTALGQGAGVHVFRLIRPTNIPTIVCQDVRIQIDNAGPFPTPNAITITNVHATPITTAGFASFVDIDTTRMTGHGAIGLTGSATGDTGLRLKNSEGVGTVTTNTAFDNVLFDANSKPSTITAATAGVPLDKFSSLDFGANVVLVSTEADFGTVVPATRIDVTPGVIFILDAPVAQTLLFLGTTGSNMTILTNNRTVNTLTYTNASDAQFQGTNFSVEIVDVVLEGNETASAFDLDGGTVSIRDSDFNRYADVGTLRNMTDCFITGGLFEVISGGLSLIDCDKARFSTNEIIALDGNTFNFLTVSGPLSGSVQISSNVMENDAFSTFIRIVPDFSNTSRIVLSNNDVDLEDQFYDTTGISGTFNVVADATVASTTIDSVTDSGGIARFNFTVGPTVFVFQEVVNVGYVTNTDYNGTLLITAVGAGFYEVDSIDFGSDEASGSFTSDSVTLAEPGTATVNGDTLTVDTDFSTEYDGGGTVYNQNTNNFRVNRVFGVTQTGTWSQAGLDQKDIRVLAVGNPGSPNSRVIASAFVNANVTATTGIVTNVYQDVVFGTVGTALDPGSNIEGWKLVDEINGTLEYVGNSPSSNSITIDITAISSGSNLVFPFKLVKSTGGGGFVDLPDFIELPLTIGGDAASISGTIPLDVIKGDQIKPQVTRTSGGSTITIQRFVMN